MTKRRQNQTNTKRKSISKKTRFEVFKRDKFTCQFCGTSAPNSILEIDHLKPVINGGDNSLLNLITSCFECNRGKSKNEISDDSVITKQTNQLKLLEEKRQQLELLAEWKNSLSDIDKEYIKFYQKLFKKLSKLNYIFNEYGKKTILSLRKKYSDEEIIDATETSFRQYYHFPENDNDKDEQWNKALNYIPKILAVRKRTKDNPELSQLYYCRGILRPKSPYKSDWQIMQYLKALLAAGYSIDDIKDASLSCYKWSDFTSYFAE